MIDESTTSSPITTLDLELDPVTAAFQEDAAADRATAQALREYLAGRAMTEPA